MKIATFLMGSLAGAAVVMLLRRNQMVSATASSVGNRMKQSMSDMKDQWMGKALNKMLNNQKSSSSDKEQSSRSNHSAQSDYDGNTLQEIERFVSKDPEVASEVNSILEQNGQHPLS
ncbi:MAG: hypothetical protein P0Y55_06340 [Candidatus Cohnella colombiensis]|uniref:Uncharacterized protein n=1 Tax=Candidatus Cohnella colombiensis TaxID=3121368 RepID=A0AA95F101_9BACL|nr:MAG: hypothetical protein P0Y55_06340 [Cohnella sp.]